MLKSLYILQGDTTYLVYTYPTEDPIDNVYILRPKFQGSTTINLFGQPESVPPLPLDLQSFDVTNNNVGHILYCNNSEKIKLISCTLDINTSK